MLPALLQGYFVVDYIHHAVSNSVWFAGIAHVLRAIEQPIAHIRCIETGGTGIESDGGAGLGSRSGITIGPYVTECIARNGGSAAGGIVDLPQREIVGVSHVGSVDDDSGGCAHLRPAAQLRDLQGGR